MSNKSLWKPTDAVQFVSYSHPKNLLQIPNETKTGSQEGEETYLAGDIEWDTPRTSEWSEQPHPVWSNVNQVLTSKVLLNLMIV